MYALMFSTRSCRESKGVVLAELGRRSCDYDQSHLTRLIVFVEKLGSIYMSSLLV